MLDRTSSLQSESIRVQPDSVKKKRALRRLLRDLIEFSGTAASELATPSAQYIK